MNARPNLEISPHFSLGEMLASETLRLRGLDAHDFAVQFATQAARPVAVHVAGNGEIFRQAVCFPVAGTGKCDFIQPVENVPPCMVVELLSGHLICLRLNDCASGQLALGAFLRSIERSLERVPQETSDYWSGIEKSIEMVTRRRVELVDFVLEANETVFWGEIFSVGTGRLTEALFRGMPPVSASGRKDAVAALRDIQSIHYRNAVTDFLDGLNGEVIQAIRASGLAPTVANYNTYQRCEPTAARYRIQAAGAIPLLGYLFGEGNHLAIRLRRLVDDGQPLWPALADTVGVPEETVRWLRNKTADDVSDVWLGRIPVLLRSLAFLPPEKRPKNPDEWTAYTDFALVIDRPATSSQHALWIQDLGRLGWVAARKKFEAMYAAPSDLLEIKDLLREIIGAVGGELLPQVAHQWRREDDPEWQRLTEAIETLFFDISILKQIRTSLLWHELQLRPRVDEEAPEEVLPDKLPAQRLGSWPAPLDKPLKVGSLYAHFLTTTAELHLEGQRMEHCVGNYSSSCLFSGSNIVSLRKSDDRSVSTAELRQIKRGKRLGFEVIQHKAHRNSTPPPEAQAALHRLLAHLETESMQPRLQQMREDLEKRQMLDQSLRYLRADTARSPHRLRALKMALRLHVGYERFLDVARNAIDA